MLDLDREQTLLDLVQAGNLEQLGQVTLPGTGKTRLVLDIRIELARRLPKQAQRAMAARVIPRRKLQRRLGASSPSPSREARQRDRP
jgi:hypothetical protein